MTKARAIRVAFRADASPIIGTGHIKRCAALADALQTQGAQIRFVCRDHGLAYTGMLANAPILLERPLQNMVFEDDSPPSR